MKATTVIRVLGMSVLLGFFVAACGAELNPKTEGHLKSALEAKKDAFKACYEDALKRDREIQGDVGLKLDINEESGQVTSSKVEKSSIKDDEMKKCVAGAAADITLPEPPNVPVEGHYNVSFSFEK